MKRQKLNKTCNKIRVTIVYLPDLLLYMLTYTANQNRALFTGAESRYRVCFPELYWHTGTAHTVQTMRTPLAVTRGNTVCSVQHTADRQWSLTTTEGFKICQDEMLTGQLVPAVRITARCQRKRLIVSQLTPELIKHVSIKKKEIKNHQISINFSFIKLLRAIRCKV